LSVNCPVFGDIYCAAGENKIMYVCRSFRFHLFDWVPICPVFPGTFLFLEGMSHDHFSGCSNVPLVDLLDSAFTSPEECNFPHPSPGVVSSVFVIFGVVHVGANQSGICLVKLAQL